MGCGDWVVMVGGGSGGCGYECGAVIGHNNVRRRCKSV